MIVGFPFSASRIAVKALIPCLCADPIYLIMVAMINSNDVAPEECLFGNIYYFNSISGKLSIVK